MLELVQIPVFTKEHVEAVSRLSVLLRRLALRPPSPAPQIEGVFPCAARTFQSPVHLSLDTRQGVYLVKLERACIESVLDRILPGWREEDTDVLPFEWCVTWAFDLYATGTVLADADLSVSSDGTLLPDADAPAPTLFGTVKVEDRRWVVSTTLLSADPARIPQVSGPVRLDAPQILPVQIVLSLVPPRLDLLTLRRLTPGDVVVLGRTAESALPAQIRVNDVMTFAGELAGGSGFVVRRPLARSLRMEMTDKVHDDRHGSVASAEVADLPGLPLDDLPMQLEVQFRRQMMTVADIGAMASGAILDLGIDLSEPVVLKVNDKEVGTGRLVRIGDLVGVQIDRWMIGLELFPGGHSPGDAGPT